eukprot:COSAG01_NODE_471_length_16555_cov_14.196524_6_plen_119_part_00
MHGSMEHGGPSLALLVLASSALSKRRRSADLADFRLRRLLDPGSFPACDFGRAAAKTAPEFMRQIAKKVCLSLIIGGMAMDMILGHPGTAHAVEESRLVVGVGRVQLAVRVGKFLLIC